MPKVTSYHQKAFLIVDNATLTLRRTFPNSAYNQTHKSSSSKAFAKYIGI